MRLMPASEGKCLGSSSTKACVDPESNQTSRMSSTFFQPSFASLPRKRARAGGIPGVGALFLEGLDDTQFDLRVLQDLDRTVRLFLDEHRDRHAPGTLARDHPTGPALDHAGDAVLTLWRNPARDLDCRERAIAQRVAFLRNVLVHRDEPLRRVAEDDRLLRAPGMRILVLETPARDQHMRLDQRLDHRLVGVALLALVVDDAFAGESGCGFGKSTIFINCIRNSRVDATLFQSAAARSPNLKVLAPMPRRSVHEAGTRIIGHVLAGK